MADQPTERSRDTDRFLTFLDAVVAIAITLLVLPLVDVAGELRDGGSVADLLSGHVAELFAFALSFVVIARLWLVQHAVMQHVVVLDGALTRLLVLWLLLIVVLPFPTALVAEAGAQPTTKVFYVGTMALNALCLSTIAWIVAARPALRDSENAPRPVVALTSTVLLVVALVLMLLVPASGYWPLVLLVLDDRLVALWDRWRAHAG